ncbi:MAG TPA: hydroxymethylbilane synthase, partial [Myxococcota bacterium]|nr:hydroxymethylbilane synthase [Myxococcota bacterium]
MRRLRLGTRGSALARAQSGHVAEALSAITGAPVDMVIIRTRGDEITDRPLGQVGGKGLFTKEIEDAMLRGEVDLAVHSLKDLPTESPVGLVVGAHPRRADARDVIVG